MDWCCTVFFFNRKGIHRKYAGFFGEDQQDEQMDGKGLEDTPQIPPKEAAARFYFNLTYRLAKEDITKMEEVEEMNLYMCLNVASLLKDEYDKQMEEQRKFESQLNKR